MEDHGIDLGSGIEVDGWRGPKKLFTKEKEI